MPERPPDLPEYDHPPVVEVAIGIQFEAIRPFRQAHIGLFWNEVRDEYPTVRDQPRLEGMPDVVEFGESRPALQIEFADSPPVQRAWFVSRDETLLIQVQDDRLIHNWRHRGGSYPRFEPLLDLFWARFDSFQKALHDVHIKMTSVQWADVTYINWIPVTSMEQFFRPAMAAELDLPGVGPRPSAQVWSARYPIQENNDLVGELAVETQPGLRLLQGERKPVSGFQLALTFRAPVAPGASRDRVAGSLLRGRDVIVKTFDAITTSEMHDVWGRRK